MLRMLRRRKVEISGLFYSTLSKRLGELNYLIVKRIFELVVSRLNRSARRSLKLKKELLAIDSTTITVGKNRLPWALYHGERSGIKLHVSFTNRMGMPLTKNAVFSQLFSALIAYVLLKFLHIEGHKKNNCKRLSFR